MHFILQLRMKDTKFSNKKVASEETRKSMKKGRKKKKASLRIHVQMNHPYSGWREKQREDTDL